MTRLRIELENAVELRGLVAAVLDRFEERNILLVIDAGLAPFYCGAFGMSPHPINIRAYGST